MSSKLANTVLNATLHQTSIGPSSASTRSAAASTALASATSTGTTSGVPPAARTSSAAACRPFSPRASSATLSPRRANAIAVARPIPALAPVTTTTLSLIASHPLLECPFRSSRAPPGGQRPAHHDRGGRRHRRPRDPPQRWGRRSAVGHRVLRPALGQRAPSPLPGKLHHLRDVQRAPAGAGVGDLRAAGEAVGHDHPPVVGVADRGQQGLLAAVHRDVVLALFEPPRTG